MHVKKIKKILFKNGVLINPDTGEISKGDLLIINGKIKEIGEKLKADDADIIELGGLYISPGFVDVHVHFREPGREDEETLETGARAALAGGFTTVCCMPNTEPAIDSREYVEYVRRASEKLLVDIYPIAAVSKGRKGMELSEMAELSEAGAVAFSDDGSPLMKANLMRNALEYSRMFNKPIINHAEDESLKNNGLMNEGFVSSELGLPGIPDVSESIMVYRDVEISRFVGGKLHVPHVSTAESVEIIRQAKAHNVDVSAEVTPHHFSLRETDLYDYDTNKKMNPPLRAEKDLKALIEGLKDGTIDIIATDHAPHSVEEKETTFDLAAPGLIGLETALGLIISRLVNEEGLNLVDVLRKITINPRKRFNLPEVSLKEGSIASLTIFDPDERWVFEKKHIRSKSRNTPFIGTELTGRVKFVFTKNHLITLRS